jgi:hypothetical protein
MATRFTVYLVHLFLLLILVCAFETASAQPPAALTGIYTGEFLPCSEREDFTTLKLTLLVTPDGGVFGTFTFFLPAGTQKDAYSYSLQGRLNPAKMEFTLVPVKWETTAPPGFNMMSLSGFSVRANELAGSFTLNGKDCGSFLVRRTGAPSSSTETSTVPPAATVASVAPAPQVAAASPPAPPTSSPAPVRPRATTPAPAASANPTLFSATSNRLSDAEVRKQLRTRELHWRPDKDRPQSVLKAEIKFVNDDDAVFAEAVCASNGVSVSFMLYDGTDDQKGPQFANRRDPNTESHAPVVDVTVRTDGRSHLAKGFLALDGDNAFVNNVGLLFYDPSIAAQVRGQRRLEVRTGTPLDVLTQPLALAGADAEIEEGLRTSAGPVSDLLNARSIEMDFPLLDSRTAKATLELSPQDPAMHAFVARCGGTSSSPAPAPASGPANTSRTPPANPGGSRPTR